MVLSARIFLDLCVVFEIEGWVALEDLMDWFSCRLLAALGLLGIGLGCGGKKLEPTYYGDVEPILRARCSNCHQAGGIGPYVFDTYETAQKFADMIKHTVANRIMPPMPADPTNCRPLIDSRQMLESERDTLIAWVDQGGKAGIDDKNDERGQGMVDFGAAAIRPADVRADFGFTYSSEVVGK